jgi:glutaredoxin
MSGEVVLFTRQGCHLCDEAKAEIERLRASAEFTLQVVDIDSDADLRAQYNEQVPVIFINGRKAFKYRIDAAKFLKLVGGA